jgi:hypothetical protein
LSHQICLYLVVQLPNSSEVKYLVVKF